jgi:hypothetical protein
MREESSHGHPPFVQARNGRQMIDSDNCAGPPRPAANHLFARPLRNADGCGSWSAESGEAEPEYAYAQVAAAGSTAERPAAPDAWCRSTYSAGALSCWSLGLLFLIDGFLPSTSQGQVLCTRINDGATYDDLADLYEPLSSSG